MDAKDLAGSVKAAILIKSLDQEAARKILSTMSESEKNLINGLISQLGEISPELVEKVAEEFSAAAGYMETTNKKSNSGIDKKAEEKNNKEKGNNDNKNKEPVDSLNALQSIDPDQLLLLIKNEHPQTIAIIIAHLKSGAAGKVLSGLPDEVKIDVAVRIANLDKLVSGMVDEINTIFEDILKNNETANIKETNGVSRLAEILNQIDGSDSGLIMDEIEEAEPELADKIRSMMFVFDDIILVDDKGLQNVLRSVETSELALALKAASEEVQNKVFRNMSERAGLILKEEVEMLGAVRMKAVADAQQSITRIVQDKESKGEIIISGREGEDFV